MNVQRIVVADHHPLCRAGLASLLSEHFEIGELVQASDFPHTLAALARASGTAMVPVNMTSPDERHRRVRKLRADYPSLLLVRGRGESWRELVLDALCAGVHGYILKATPVVEMARAFESILAGHIYVPPLVSDVTVKASASAVVTPSSSAALTDRQFEVLKLVAAGRSNKEIARSLFIAEARSRFISPGIPRAWRPQPGQRRRRAAHQRATTMLASLFPGLFAEETDMPGLTRPMAVAASPNRRML